MVVVGGTDEQLQKKKKDECGTDTDKQYEEVSGGRSDCEHGSVVDVVCDVE